MDKPAKRRVLSLSLSQPSKQQRRHKLKRHVSSSSSKEETCSESSKSIRDGSNLPTTTSHDPPTRYGSLGQSDIGDGDLLAKALESKGACQEGPELQPCNGLMDNILDKSEIDCITEGNENVCKDDKCKNQSNISDDSLKKISPKPQSIHSTSCDTNQIEGSSQNTGEDIGCKTTTIDTDLEVLQCPLCLRTFEKLISKTSHIKSCASKRKLPTHQLIEILELQKRQAAERRALGLPTVLPVPVAVKKSVSLKKENRKARTMDSNLQLAMALSLSMQDQIQSVEQVNLTDPSRESSLERFGFTTKSVLGAAQGRANIPSSRGKANTIEKIKPILLTRTAEERQQIITEKIAMVLLEEKKDPIERENLETVSVKSTFLQEVLNKENVLWSKAYSSPSKNDRASYYVQSLQGFISPSKVEIGSKVMHLSQVVGRDKTPTKELKQRVADEVVSTSHSEEDSTSDAISPLLNETKNPAHIEMKLRAKLFNDWAGMVNNSTMSDLMIYPQEGREIPTHKLILSVRCPRILKDISKQCNSLTGNHVEVIMWSKTPHAAALAFLEYIYCGSVKSIRVLSGDLSSVSWLATHYKISDLLQYLCAIKEETSNQTASQVALNVIRNIDYVSNSSFDFEGKGSECKEAQPNQNNSIPTIHSKDSKRSCIQSLPKPLINQVTAPPRRASSKSETDSIYSEITTHGSEVRSLCSSPDLFGEEEATGTQEENQTENANSLCPNSTLSKCTSTTMLPLISDFGKSDRPPSSNSISSDKTVLCENKSSHSHGSPIASANIDILERDTFSASPVSSLASADSVIIDPQKFNSRKSSLLSNESKRKLSNSSQDSEKSGRKRLCPHVSEKNSNEESIDTHVDFFDLTQDSDSSVSPAAVKKRISLDSCDRVCISSDSESHYQEAHKEQILEELCEDVMVERSCSAGIDHKSGLADGCNDVRPIGSESSEQDAYVSPVWDGFEDLNYDDQFLFAPQPPDVNDQQDPASVTSLSSKNHSRCGSPAANSLPHEISEPKEGKAVDIEGSSASEPFLKSVGNSNPASGFNALLDDSLNINDSILQGAECGILTQRETKGTPVNRILSSVNDPDVTPLANYSVMKTPELKRELQKFGLKPTLGKRKGKIMLRHIYNELHPWVPEASNERFQEKCSVSQPVDVQEPSQSNVRKLSFLVREVGRSDAEPLPRERHDTECDSDSDSSDCRSSVNTSLQEIKFMEESCEDVQMNSQALHPPNKNLREVVFDYITNDSKLHRQVLEYEPIWIEKLHSDLRSNGYKFKMEDIMSYLDEKCITFRTNNSGPRLKRRKQKKVTTTKKISATENSGLSDE
ncbi:Structure-specific endonuclease subunit SLX4 [Frankliniella fusca]|uniref:Structure-specific endonuclease subunit SLX4 n=1 Tax=Frankliniella fusca TaxID=407009 RepID=A0AAE1L837_9NEOP|nr:Structure-specific endonuclease subunit SLX4 [Frankliniella fusca]